MVILDTTIVNVALPTIGSDLHTDLGGLQWIVDSYLVVLAAGIVTGGALADRWSARRVFQLGVMSFVVTSLACGLAPNAEVLVACRIAQGAAAALCVPSSLALVRAAYAEPSARRRAIAVWGGIAGLAAAAGPVVGGISVWAWSWRAVFLFNVPIGLIVMALTARHARQESPRPRRLDLAGQTLALTSLATLAVALIEGARRGLCGPVIAVACVFVATAAAFVRVESRTPEPMLPLGLFRSPAFTGCAVIGALINFGFYGGLFILNLYFQRVRAASALDAALALLPELGMITIGAVVSARISLHVGGARGTAMVGLAASAAGTVGLLLTGAHTAYAVLIAPLAATGFGMGVLMPAVTATLTDSAPWRHAGVAAGVIGAARQTGSLIGVATLGGIVAGSTDSVVALRWALAAAALAFLISIAVAARWMPLPSCAGGLHGGTTATTPTPPWRFGLSNGVSSTRAPHVRFNQPSRRNGMTISANDKVPDVDVHVLGNDGMPVAVRTADILGTGKVVLFGVPGAFTPNCSRQHLPGFVAGADALAGKGVTVIACVSVNDAWVMDAWAEMQGAKGKILMLADGNRAFTEAMGLALDGDGFGLGARSQRYAAVIEDGVITRLEIEADTGVNVSACEYVIATL